MALFYNILYIVVGEYRQQAQIIVRTNYEELALYEVIKIRDFILTVLSLETHGQRGRN